ncbi:enoyl-CoA hydratase-related protein [Kiloniella laminariae]|uniref:Enoyl-CoA hydratase-related protein n=1 Tax=Kiloniella laminariae TaxID=454162 RepID=A0ABT4LGB9_9PROT|nr:enoyl-CoA hydratase-related protein [Kiloniella laminariae]MCZ4279376.1 enoyl-CoA hydratase-related protein [Kiloniella laminariae]
MTKPETKAGTDKVGSVLFLRDGAIATVILNRPEKLNAFNLAMWERLGDVMQDVSADDSLHCVVIRGAGGRAFAAGADIAEFEQVRFSSAQAEEYAKPMDRAAEAIRDCPHPTLAFIEGACMGGGLELAAQCDLRIANASAKFGIPINRIGNVLPSPAMRALVDLVGRSTTLELLLEGRIFTAEEAYAKGLVGRIVDDLVAEEEVYKSATRIAEGAPLAARWHKRHATRALDSKPLSSEEHREPFLCCDTDDYKEGIRAFLEKRKPVFRGK